MKEKTVRKVCRVNGKSIFRQMSNNTINSREMIREALNNSIDANAKNVTIIQDIDDETGMFTLEIIDEGNGMSLDEIDDFFSLAYSSKGETLIGEKGLGSITFFRCNRLVVESQKNNKRYRAVLDNPIEKLRSNDELTYSIEEVEQIKDGTSVKVIGYELNHPERMFNLLALKDYILWWTGAGSFKNKFMDHDEVKKIVGNIDVVPHVQLIDNINNLKETFNGEHPFCTVERNPKSTEEDMKRSKNYARSFGPYHESTFINNKMVSVQIHGEVAGYNKRSEIVSLTQGEGHKSRFGVILCKDFIPVENRKDYLLDDANYNHYHILINSQNFELNADRSKISNMDCEETKWIIATAERIVKEEICKVAKEEYFKIKDEEEREIARMKKLIEIRKRISKYTQRKSLKLSSLPAMKEPTNESQVIVLMASLMALNKIEEYSIGEYSSFSATDILMEDRSGNILLAEVEFKLSNLFLHNHPLESLDIVVCWEVDMVSNEMKYLYDEAVVLKKDNEGYYLSHGINRTIRIIELQEVVEGLRETA